MGRNQKYDMACYAVDKIMLGQREYFMLQFYKDILAPGSHVLAFGRKGNIIRVAVQATQENFPLYTMCYEFSPEHTDFVDVFNEFELRKARRWAKHKFSITLWIRKLWWGF